jgi:predicted nucleic acid-binding Zn ribbon protein
MTPRRRPRQLADVLEPIQERLAPPDLLAAVQRHWREAVGDTVADEAWPDHERGGRVTVRCRSAVWAAELTMLENDLLRQVNERLAEERQVLALKFTAAPPSRRSP